MTAPAVHLPRGLQVPPLVPGSPEWLRHMSASKIAAVVGLSPYESRFSLWHRMAGLVPQEPDSDTLRRGHYLEPSIAAWFADQHPEVLVKPAPTFVSPHDPNFTATPDRVLTDEDGQIVGLLEAKNAADADDWGAPGTDEIPPGYRAQVIWQMDCAGVPVTHVAVLTSYLDFREYVVHHDAAEAEYLRREGRAFLDSLPAGAHPERPNLDGHTATYLAVKQLHPEIDDVDVELDPDLAREFCQARRALAAAETRSVAATAAVADVLGSGRRARFLNKTIAYRQAKGEGTPYLVAGRSLPTFED